MTFSAKPSGEAIHHIVVFPDLQVLTKVVGGGTYFPSDPVIPNILETNCQWVADNKTKYNIDAVVSVGDITQLLVDGYSGARAKAAFTRFTDVGVKFFTPSGNHDAFNQNYLPRAWATWIGSIASEDGVPADSGIGGGIENSWTTFYMGGKQVAVLTLEWGLRQSVLDWAKAKLNANPGATTILSIHGYMCSDGTRFDWFGKGEAQSPYSPYNYQKYPSQGVWGQYNDGELVFQNLVKLYPQIKLVVCGHDNHNNSTLVDYRSGGTSVVQMGFSHNTPIDDPVASPPYRNGSMRLIGLDFTGQKLHVQTVSPWSNHIHNEASARMVLDFK